MACFRRFELSRVIIPQNSLCMLIWVWIHTGQPCVAAFEPFMQGARANSMGMTSASVRAGPFGPDHNPAVLAVLPCISAGVTHTRLFGLKDLTQTALMISLPFKQFGIGFGTQVFGNALYRETSVQAGLGIRIRPNYYLGLLCNAGQLYIQHYGSAASLWLNTGLLYQFSEKLTLVFTVRNLNRACLGQSNGPVPQTLRIGISCHPDQKVMMKLELIKDNRFPQEIRSGIEVSPISSFKFRCGFTDRPQRITFGIGIRTSLLNLDYGAVGHPILDFTHHLTCSFMIHRNRS